MELDDLRRQWREPEMVVPRALTATQLHELLASQRSGLVEKIRRNTRWDVGLGSVMLLVAFAVSLPDRRQALTQLFAGILLVFFLLLGYYYYRMTSILRRLDETTGSVHSHLVQLCAGLRRLVRSYYYLSLGANPALLVLIYGFFVGKELVRPAAFRWEKLGLVAVALLAFGAVLQVVIVYASRWWVQRLYGQHLDRLESQLHELEDAELPVAAR
jgi:hypothetical protein